MAPQWGKVQYNDVDKSLVAGGHRLAMYPRVFMTLVGLALFGVVQVTVPKTTAAIPAMSRQTGEPCSTCHDVIPKLNYTGQHFRANGFRLPDLKGRDEKSLPRSTERKSEAKPEPAERSMDELSPNP